MWYNTRNRAAELTNYFDIIIINNAGSIYRDLMKDFLYTCIWRIGLPIKSFKNRIEASVCSNISHATSATLTVLTPVTQLNIFSSNWYIIYCRKTTIINYLYRMKYKQYFSIAFVLSSPSANVISKHKKFCRAIDNEC